MYYIEFRDCNADYPQPNAKFKRSVEKFASIADMEARATELLMAGKTRRVYFYNPGTLQFQVAFMNIWNQVTFQIV